MSTLIMPSGALSSDSTTEYPTIFADLKTSDLQYSSDCDLSSSCGNDDRLSAGPQRQLAFNHYETTSGDFIHPSESPLSTLSSTSEFMTSSHYPATAGQTPPLTSSTPESVSPLLPYQRQETMTATVSTFPNQGWTGNSYNGQMLQKQNSILAEVDHTSHSPQRGQTQPNVMMTASNMQTIGSMSQNIASSPKTTGIPAVVSDRRRHSNAGLNEQQVAGNLQLMNETPFVAYSSESFAVGGELVHRSPTRMENTLLSPIPEKNVLETSVSGLLSMSSTARGGSPVYVHPTDDVQHAYQLSADSFSRNRHYRHHSYANDRRASNITPPSPHTIQDMYSMSNNEMTRSTFVPSSEADIKPYLMSSGGVLASAVSPHLVKKSLSVGPDFSHVKPEIISHHSHHPTSYSDVLLSPQGHNRFRGIEKDTPMDSKSNFVSMLNSPVVTSAAYCDAEQTSHSPQRSPTDLSVSSPRALVDYQAYQHHNVFDEQLRQLREQQQAASIPSEILSSYRSAERAQYLSQEAQVNAFTNQLRPGLTAPSLLKQESDGLYPSTLPYNGQMYLTIPSTSNNYHPFRSHYSAGSEPHHPYSAHHERAGSSAMNSSLRPSSEGLCAVCGDNAACQHYGVRTCEGCKGFFKRTVQRKSVYNCLANKNCPVNKRTRNRCQFCRFEKCLAVGMVKEVVRTDHLKGRRGRLPSKPKGPKDPVAPPSPPVSFITSLVRAHVDTNPAISNTDTSKYRPPGMPPCSPPLTAAEETHKFYELLATCLPVIRQWAEKIPGFCSLSQEDQTILVESSFMEIFAFRLAYRTEIQEGKLVFCNGIALHRDQLLGSFGDWIDTIIAFACSLSELNVDLSSFSCMLALTLFQNRPGLRDSQKVEEMQGLVIESLKEHVNKSSVTADRPNYFMKLLGITPALRDLALLGSQRLYRHKIESPSLHFPPSLQKTLDLLTTAQ